MFNSIEAEFKKESPQEKTASEKFRQFGRLGRELAEVDSKILEILVGEVVEEVYNTE